MIQEFLSPRVEAVIDQWKYYFSLLKPFNDSTVLDIGCNTAEIPIFLCQEYSEVKKIVGIERKVKLCDSAKARIEKYKLSNKIEIINLEANSLPFEDNTFDRVILAETLEWVEKRELLLIEIKRVLKKNGIALITHADFDTQVFNVEDKELNREIIHKFCDFGPDGQIGRKLLKYCRDANFSKVEPYVYTITDSRFTPESYSFKVASLMVQWMKHANICNPEKLDQWFELLKKSYESGLYFYSINKYICKCVK